MKKESGIILIDLESINMKHRKPYCLQASPKDCDFFVFNFSLKETVNVLDWRIENAIYAFEDFAFHFNHFEQFEMKQGFLMGLNDRSEGDENFSVAIDYIPTRDLSVFYLDAFCYNEQRELIFKAGCFLCQLKQTEIK